MQEKLNQIKEAALKEIESKSATIEEIKVKYLGKKGELTTILRSMGNVSKEERPVIGKLVNDVKKILEDKIEEVTKKAKEEEKHVTLPGKKNLIGKRHPIETTLQRMKDIFVSMGFSIEDGPEVELDYYNFEALNIPKNHPARSEQDTLYINDDVVLRTQTSPMQIRVMENKKPPIRIIAPGREPKTTNKDDFSW